MPYYVTTKCCKCGKKINKRLRFTWNNPHTQEKVEEEDRKFKSQPHLCNKCKKLELYKNNYDSLDITAELDHYKDRILVLSFLERDLDELQSLLQYKYGDKVIKYMDNEYIIDNIHRISHTNIVKPFAILLTQINKKTPWELTNTQITIYSDVVLNPELFQITNENFSDREKYIE